jgi:hypothetical protein
MRPSSRLVIGFPGCLCASAIALLFATGCGRSAGERCQVKSDCASGLICEIKNSTGNGICTSNTGSSLPDAATGPDAPLSSGPEVQAEDVQVEDAQVQIDAQQSPADAQASVDAEAVKTPDAAVRLDGTAVDLSSVDTGSID